MVAQASDPLVNLRYVGPALTPGAVVLRWRICRLCASVIAGGKGDVRRNS
jgi:hypothetical protein